MKYKRRIARIAVLAVIVSLSLSLLLIFAVQRLEKRQMAYEEKGDQALEAGAYQAALAFWLKSEGKSQNPAQLFLKIAGVSLKLSNLDRAEMYYLKAFKKMPENPAVQKELIRLYLLKGDLKAAKDLLPGAGDDIHNRDYQFSMLLGDYYLMQSDAGRAETAYRKAVHLAPEQIRPRIKLAICLGGGNTSSPVEIERKNEAETLLSQISINDVTAVEDLVLMSDYFALIKKLQMAETCILKAASQDPDNVELKAHVCRFYLSCGMLARARLFLEQVCSQYPEHRGFQFMLADTYLSSLEMDPAEKILSAPEIKKNGDDIGYLLLMGKLWLYKGRHSHAVSYFKSALDKNFGLTSAHYLLGIAYFAGGQVKLAENEFTRALLITPNHIDSLLAMATLFYKQGKYKLADQHIEKVLRLDYANGPAWQIKGLCLLARENCTEASRAFTTAWHLGEGQKSLYFLGRCFEHKQKPREAEKIYKSILETFPDDMDTLNRYCMILADLGKSDQAFAMINKQLDIENSVDPRLLYIGAKLGLKVKNFPTCNAYLNFARHKKMFLPEFFILEARMWRGRNNREKEIQSLVECTETAPLFADGWQLLAKEYVGQGKFTLAEETLEKAITHFPDDPDIAGNLAWLLLEKEYPDTDRAFQLARKAYDHLPDKAWLMDTLGWAYFHKGTYSQAEWMFTQALEKHPGNGIVTYHLGMAYYKQGRLSEAKKTLNAALETDGFLAAHKDEIYGVLESLSQAGQEKGADAPFSMDSGTSGQDSAFPSDMDDTLDQNLEDLFIEQP